MDKKFTWQMTEENWKELKENHQRKEDMDFQRADNMYGQCTCGNMCAEILHTHDDSDWYAYSNVYALGIHTGYGVTEDGVPYSLLEDGPTVPMDAVTFEEFKENFEKSFAAYIEKQNVFYIAN